jgi:hypothetical protein
VPNLSASQASAVPIARDVWEAPATYLVLLVALAGASFGVAVMLIDIASWSPTHRQLATSGPFILWMFLVAVQTAFWALAAFPVGRLVRTYGRYWKREWVEALVSAGLFLVLIGGAIGLADRVTGVRDYLPHSVLKISMVTLIGCFLAIGCAIGIWLGRCALTELVGKEPTLETLTAFADVRRNLDRLLALLGALLALGVLATAAQRETVLVHASYTGTEVQYPAELVLVYGLAFSAVLALAVLPTYATLQATGVGLLNQIAPIEGTSDIKEIVEQRDMLGELFGLRVSPIASLRAALAILSPLLGSLVGLIPEVT